MRLLRGIWKLLVGVKDFLVLIFMLIFFIALYAALSMRPNPAVPSSGALLVRLDGAIVEQPREVDPITMALGGSPATREYRLRDVVRGIRVAAADKRVKAVVLDLDRFAGGGQAALATLGAAIDEVRRAGKPVLAYATGYDDDAYLLAAHASEVWLEPLGTVLITGPGGSRLYYKGLLDKLGVIAKIYRVGEFKSAVEPFTRTDQSPEAREANQALADSLWESWRQDVARARPSARLAEYVANPEAMLAAARGDVAGAALAARLVDRIGDRLAFGRRVAALAGEGPKKQPGSFRTIKLDNWIAANPEKGSGDPVGVLTIAGTIVDGDAPAGTAGGDTIAKLLLEELPKRRIKALVVRIDSPGGSVTGSERIRSAILAAKAQGLPVVVSMGSVAASGGYWVSTPADRVLAEPSTITGSIGVFGIVPTFPGTLAKAGISTDGVKTTPLSGQPDLMAGTSPEFDRLIQSAIEDIYRRFTGIVAQSRRMTPARVDAIGQGRVWAGGTARQIGLVDRFGSLDDAIAEAARLAKLDPAKVRPIFIEREPNPLRKLLGDALAGPSEQETGDAWSRIAGRPDAILRGIFTDVRQIAAGPAIQVRCLDCPAAAPPAVERLGLAELVASRIGR
jgi:protease-4